jgi:hypothetical protein
MQEGCTEKMIDENGNRCADPRPTLIRENGTLWLKTRDGRLHAMTLEEVRWLMNDCARALNAVHMIHQNRPYDPPKRKTSYTLT